MLRVAMQDRLLLRSVTFFNTVCRDRPGGGVSSCPLLAARAHRPGGASPQLMQNKRTNLQIVQFLSQPVRAAARSIRKSNHLLLAPNRSIKWVTLYSGHRFGHRPAQDAPDVGRVQPVQPVFWAPGAPTKPRPAPHA